MQQQKCFGRVERQDQRLAAMINAARSTAKDQKRTNVRPCLLQTRLSPPKQSEGQCLWNLEVALESLSSL